MLDSSSICEPPKMKLNSNLPKMCVKTIVTDTGKFTVTVAYRITQKMPQASSRHYICCFTRQLSYGRVSPGCNKLGKFKTGFTLATAL